MRHLRCGYGVNVRWQDHVTNDEISRMKEREMLNTIIYRKRNWDWSLYDKIFTSWCIGLVNGRVRFQIMYVIVEKRKYAKLYSNRKQQEKLKYCLYKKRQGPDK